MSDDIKELLKEIRELKSQINETNQRVINHIDFVEKVFDVVRIPFFRLMSMVSSNEQYCVIEDIKNNRLTYE
jgi:hypothetical protein